MSENAVLTLDEIIKAVNNPNFWSGLQKDLKLERPQYWLARLAHKMRKEAESKAYSERRRAIIDRLAVKKDGQVMTRTNLFGAQEADFGTNAAQARAAFDELHSVEIDLGIRPVKLKIKDLAPLNSAEIEALLPLLDIDESENPSTDTAKS